MAKNHPPASTGNRQANEVLLELRKLSSPEEAAKLSRYGIVASSAIGVPMKDIQSLAKKLGPNQGLAESVWETGVYEARLLCAYIGQPERLTAEQMDRWCDDFDNWGVCDTLCFALFDRTPHAWQKVDAWCVREEEFVKRAGFALLASLAGHDNASGDDVFLARLPLIERAAVDERNFVKKGVSWALRRMGGRSAALHAACVELAERMDASSIPAERWLGRDALKDLMRPTTMKRFAASGKAAKKS